MAETMIVMQVVKGRDAMGANKLLQMLAKAADKMQLDGVEALRVRYHAPVTQQTLSVHKDR